MSGTPLAATSLFRRLLTEPRLRPNFGRLEALALSLYAAILALTIPFHEPWYDEAQGWLIARDNSLFDIFYRRLHYEGSPGLWHFILWISLRLHVPYTSISWISGAFALAGTYALLRYSPFPPLIRVLLPFTFYLQYQYAVVARSYAVTPLLGFLLCALFFLPIAHQERRPILFALLAGMMANLSLYAFLWSGSLALFYAARVFAARAALSRRTLVGASAVLLSLFLFAFYTAFPASDLVSRPDGANYFEANPSSWAAKLLPPTPPPAGWKPVQPLDQSLGGTLTDPVDTTRFTRGNTFQRALMKLAHPADAGYKAQTRGHRVLRVILALSGLFYSLSSSNLLAAAFLLVTFAWTIARRSFRFLLPVLLMSLLGAMTNLGEHHSGLLFLAILTALWLAWKNPQAAIPHTEVLTPLFSLVFLAVVVQQAAWGLHASVSDIKRSYDPGLPTARYLQENAVGKRVVAYRNISLSATPYLGPHSFVNQPVSYWIYSKNFPYEDRLPLELARHPDIVVSGVEYYRTDTIANQLMPEWPPDKSAPAIPRGYLDAFGYYEKTRFCGDRFFRGGVSFTYCNIISVPVPGSSHANDAPPLPR